MGKKLIVKSSVDLSPRAERVELIAVLASLLAVCVALPLVMQLMPLDSWLRQGGDQWIMGSVVNCALIIAGVQFKNWSRTSAVVFLPSIAHIMLYFALGTPVFGLYMVPAIWLGNFAIILAFRYLHVNKKWNFGISAIVGIVAKAAIIFGFFSILVSLGAIPQVVATGMTARMGINQVLVAAIGCVSAFAVLKACYPLKKEIRLWQ